MSTALLSEKTVAWGLRDRTHGEDAPMGEASRSFLPMWNHRPAIDVADSGYRDRGVSGFETAR